MLKGSAFFEILLDDINQISSYNLSQEIKKFFDPVLTDLSHINLLKFYFEFSKLMEGSDSITHIFNCVLFEWLFLYGDKKQWLISRMNELTNNNYEEEIKNIVDSIKEEDFLKCNETCVDENGIYSGITDILFFKFKKYPELYKAFSRIYDRELA